MSTNDPFIRAVRIAAARELHGKPMNRVPDGTPPAELSMWYGYSTVDKRPAKPPIDRPINILPTNEREDISDPPNRPAWVNTNCPPWICPPYWAQPFDDSRQACVPSYEVAVLLTPCIEVPQDYVLVIRNIAYEVLNAAPLDVFQFDFLVDGATKISIEDLVIDSAAANPNRRYGLASSLRMMTTHIVVDRNHSLCIRATLRGAINLAGLSPNFPGQPITTGDCTMKVFMNGWLANLRENTDGGPRPTDLGDAGFNTLEQDQERGGFP